MAAPAPPSSYGRRPRSLKPLFFATGTLLLLALWALAAFHSSAITGLRFHFPTPGSFAADKPASPPPSSPPASSDAPSSPLSAPSTDAPPLSSSIPASAPPLSSPLPSSVHAGSPTPSRPSNLYPWISEPADLQTTHPRFTPEVLLSAPRRSAAVPNRGGTLALYSLRSYSFETRHHSTEIRILDVAAGTSARVTDAANATEPHWLTDTEFLYRRPRDEGEGGGTELVAGRVTASGVATAPVATVPGAIEGIKVRALSGGEVALVAAGQAESDGTLAASEKEDDGDADAGRSSARLYDALFVRHWDHYVTPRRRALFYGLLRPHPSTGGGGAHGPGKRWELTDLRNALADTPLASPLEPWPGPEHYDLGPRGLAFVAKDPDLDPAWNTRSDAYFVPIADFAAAPSRAPRKLVVEGFEGAATSPVFAPNGESLAWLQMKENGYESDKNRVLLLPDVARLESESTPQSGAPGAIELLDTPDGEGAWDRSPSRVAWSGDGHALYLVADDEGTTRLFRLPLEPAGAKATPSTLPAKLDVPGSVDELHTLRTGTDELLVTSTSFVDSSTFVVLAPSQPVTARVVSSLSRNGTAFALAPAQLSSITFPSPPITNTSRVSDEALRHIHAWVLTPPDFTKGKKYPLALLIHGGPQGSWTDAWSTRWNPAVFAAQGYLVVLPDPTGSTGYGRALTDAIRGDWGGAPYHDLVACMDHVTQAPPSEFALADAVDAERAVALGASFGGFMVHWLNGHALGRRFRALVCHDGAFSLAGQTASDEQYFPAHEFGSGVSGDGSRSLWWTADDAEWSKHDPARFAAQWRTPTLVVHGERDYRLLMGEALGAFNALQRRGVESRLMIFPDEGHWVLGEENARAWHTVVLNWINGFVGLDPVGAEPVVQNPARKRRPGSEGTTR